MHVDAFGKKLVGVGDTIYSMHPHSTALDAFREHLRLTLGDGWWQQEATQHPLAQHAIARWQAHVDGLMRDADRDELGRCLVPSDAIMSAYMTPAYDLWIVRDNIRLQARITDRLRCRGSPGPFDMLVVTSIPNLLGTPGEPARPWTFACWHPDETRIPSELRDAITTALRQYGRIPEFEAHTTNVV
jgi:hypothetical protein